MQNEENQMAVSYSSLYSSSRHGRSPQSKPVWLIIESKLDKSGTLFTNISAEEIPGLSDWFNIRQNWRQTEQILDF